MIKAKKDEEEESTVDYILSLQTLDKLYVSSKSYNRSEEEVLIIPIIKKYNINNEYDKM